MSGTDSAAIVGLRIGTSRDDVDVDVVHAFLAEQSYWCRGVPRDVVARAIEHSLCFSARLDRNFVGFARVVTDCATFAYLCDVFVLPQARGRGISKAMMAAIDGHPELQGLRRFLLATSDAHGLYAQHSFTPILRPERFMERYRPDAYLVSPLDAGY